MVNLESYLESTSPKLYDKYTEIIDACEHIWQSVNLPYFTDHSPDHSRRLVKILDKILKNTYGTNIQLAPDECFILLASCYLHDIGMQDLRGKPYEQLAEADFKRIRKEHSQKSFELIKEGVLKINGHDSVDLRLEGKTEWARALMYVCKAHSTDYFKPVVEHIESDPLVINGNDIRGSYLCALLMIADELDLPRARADIDEVRLFDLSSESLLHWYTHYYTSKIDITDQEIVVTFRVPESFSPNVDSLKKRVNNKIVDQLNKCNPIFAKATKGTLSLSFGQPICRYDDVDMMRKMPDKVVKLLLESVAPKASKAIPEEADSAPLTSYTPPTPSPLFTGRVDDLKTLEEMVSEHPVSMIIGIGGTGKTELTAEYVANQKRYDASKVLWFDLLQNQTVDDIAVGLSKGEMLKAEKLTPQQKGVNLAYALEQSKNLIVIDNAQEYFDAAFEEILRYAVKHLKESRILLVGKAKHDVVIELEPQLGVKEISGLENDGIEFARKLKGKWNIAVSEEDLATICRDVDNHPLAIEVALRILRYGAEPSNLLQKLVTLSGKPQEILSKSLLGELHKHATEEQRQLAYRLSVFRKPFPRIAAGFISGNPNWNMDFNELVDKLMLRLDGKQFTMHPLVRAFCNEELIEKTDAHNGAAKYYKSMRTEAADINIESEVVHHLLAAGLRQEACDVLLDHSDNFLMWGHTSALLAMLQEYAPTLDGVEARLINMRGRVLYCIANYDAAFTNFTAAANALDMIARTEAIYRMADINLTRSNLVDAQRLFEASLSLAQDAHIDYLVAYSVDGLGRVAQNRGQLTIALALYNDAYTLLIRIPDVKQLDVAIAIGNIGSALYDQGKLDDALKKDKESLGIFEAIGARSNIATTLNNIGAILQAQGHLKKAIERRKESLNILEGIGALADFALLKRNIAHTYFQLNELHNSILSFLEADAYYRKLEIKNEVEITRSLILEARKEIGYKRFCEIAKTAYEELPEDIKPYSGYAEYVKDDTIRHEEPKVGRNDPCPCGSGKKYKRCCGG